MRGFPSTVLLTVSIYFFWGVGAAANTLLIPVLKSHFQLSQFQAQWVETAFYSAYFCGALLFLLMQRARIVQSMAISTRGLMQAGLTVSAMGTVIIIISLNLMIYSVILAGLFVTALGFSLQQIAANPLLVMTGGEKYGAHRLTLAGAMGSSGNMIAPVIMSYLLFSNLAAEFQPQLTDLQTAYWALICGYLLYLLVYSRIDVPDVNQADHITSLVSLDSDQKKHLFWGAAALFCYVGAEVSLQSNLPELVKSHEFLGLTTEQSVRYLSLFGGGLLIARCAGSIFNFSLHAITQWKLLIVVPSLAFIFVVLMGSFIHQDWGFYNLKDIVGFYPFILLFILLLIMSQANPASMLKLSSLLSVVLLLVAQLVPGYVGLYCIVAVSLCSALMWPCIFALTLDKLKGHVAMASAVLIMMILGGAIIPPIQGVLADINTIGIYRSYLLPVFCYGVILMFCLKNRQSQLREVVA